MTFWLLAFLIARPCLPLDWPIPPVDLWWLYQRRQNSLQAQACLTLWELAAGWMQPWVWPLRALAVWIWNQRSGPGWLAATCGVAYFLWGPAQNWTGALLVVTLTWWWCPRHALEEAVRTRWGQRA